MDQLVGCLFPDAVAAARGTNRALRERYSWSLAETKKIGGRHCARV